MSDAVTELLARVAARDGTAIDDLLPLIYCELRALAEKILAGERPGHTLQATALVHEVYLKLVNQPSARQQDRAHFVAVAAQAMRRILVDHARSRNRLKRGGGCTISLDVEPTITPIEEIDVVAVDEALRRLQKASPDASRIVDLRFFGGLTIEETAIALELSESTVEREWRYARAWLYRELGSSAGRDAREHD